MNSTNFTFYFMQKLIKKNKYLILSVSAVLLLIWQSGCGNDSVTGPANNSVTFRMMNQPGTHGGTEFLFRPNVDVKINEIVSSLPPLYDTVLNSSNYQFSKDTFYIIREFNNISSGQQWNFQFFGTVISTNAGFIVTTSYDVP